MFVALVWFFMVDKFYPKYELSVASTDPSMIGYQVYSLLSLQCNSDMCVTGRMTDIFFLYRKNHSKLKDALTRQQLERK